MALLRCREAVEEAKKKAKGDEKIGIDIVLNAVEFADATDRRQWWHQQQRCRRRSQPKAKQRRIQRQYRRVL